MFNSDWWIFEFSVNHPTLADIIENFVRIIILLFLLGLCAFLIVGTVVAFVNGIILLGIFLTLAICLFIAICMTIFNNL